MFDLTSNTTFMMSLACATLHPGLRSILILDAPSTGIQQMADILAQVLRAITNRHVKQYQLGAFESDDDVWDSPYLLSHTVETGEQPIHHLFSPERNAKELQVITIPDLTALSLVAARTVTMLIGADVVHLERNGLSACWHPQQCWVAGCESNAIGKLSPHMLDRFALRFTWKEIAPPQTQDDESAAANLLTRVPREPFQETIAPPSAYLQQVAQAALRQVEISRPVLAHLLNYIPTESYYPRREIVLARFALTLAQLSGDPSLHVGHIDRAAHMLGFTRKQALPEHTQPVAEASTRVENDAGEMPAPSTTETTASTTSLLQEITQPRTAQLPETMYTGLFDSGTVCSNPYPEDTAPIEREESMLKLPPRRYALSRSAHGAIIGTEESGTLYDLALVSTILAATRFQKVRQDQYQRQFKQRYPGLLIERMDLRRYRRSYPVEQIFLLLFDYTSTRENTNWEEALIPYLHAAYVARAGVIILKVGATDSLSPLRAEVVSAKNILVPRVGLALEVKRGQATPLAHGLSLALEQLQRVLQHGRGTAQKALFVVISDGRGNVPLAVSIRGERDTIVTREGIDDALREARKIRTLKHVETIVLNPQPSYYPDLPGRLAEALGATLFSIPLSGKALEVET